MKVARFLCVVIIVILNGQSRGYSNTPAISDTALLSKFLTETNRYFNVKTDSNFYFATKALQLATKLGLQKKIALANQYLGRYYVSNEDLGKATQYFLAALKIEEKNKDEKRIADLYDELGTVYSYMENFNKSLQYYTNAQVIYKKLNDTFNIARSIVHIGLAHGNREYCETRTTPQKAIDYQTAIDHFLMAKKMMEKINRSGGVANCNHNLASVYSRFRQPEKAYKCLMECLAYYRKENDWSGMAGALHGLGTTYRKLKQYDKSLESYKEALKVGQEHNLLGGVQFLYESMAQTYYDAHDYKNSTDYYVKYMILRDSIYNAEKSKQMMELETKYQSEKKEKEILSLTLKQKRKNLLVIVLLAIIVISALAGYFVFQRIRSRRIIAEQTNKINEQKIQQLEKDHQLIATHLVLQGEEAERSRLARDLHDGLGGLLSGIKLTLSNMKGNMVLSSESVTSYDKALGMLDSSIKELRRVAHNMMPEALVKFGLKDALSDFCHSLENKQIQINYQWFGIEKRFDQKLEIGLYRIAQELINNAFKHAQATELIVQLVQEENRASLTVQDNGKGFDTAILRTSKGAGIANIRSRVESLNGTFDFASAIGKGTEVTVEFHLNP